MMVAAVPARQGRAVYMSAGQTVRFVDTDGGQVGDVFAFNAVDVGEHLSAQHTRAATTSLFPRLGESVCATARQQLHAHSEFEAAMECVFVLSACPQDLVGINAGPTTGLRIEPLP